ncbi:MAG: hypothetical protein IT534_12755 [Bauldia sp.]|nr:hypothetical protein [Bauldia sp.]
MRPFKIIAAAAVVLAGFVSAAPAQAPAPAYDFTGRTIRLLVGNAAGGVTDTETRLVARHIVKYLPGNPSIVVQNIPGGGGMRLLEFMSQLDPVREPTIAQISSAIPFQARAGALDGLFDPRTTEWIGAFLRSTSICIVGTRSGIATVEDLRQRDATFGALSATGTTTANYAILKRGFGLRITPIYGYDTVGSIALAVARGEIDGACGPYSSYPVTFAPLIESGDLKLLLYMGPERRDDIAAPYAYDFPIVEGQLAFFEAITAAIGFSRPIIAPAGSDPAFVAAMRVAFEQMMVDPDFIAEAATLNIDLRYRSAAELAEMTAALYATPEELVAEIRAFLFE